MKAGEAAGLIFLAVATVAVGIALGEGLTQALGARS